MIVSMIWFDEVYTYRFQDNKDTFLHVTSIGNGADMSQQRIRIIVMVAEELKGRVAVDRIWHTTNTSKWRFLLKMYMTLLCDPRIELMGANSLPWLGQKNTSIYSIDPKEDENPKI